MHINTKPIESAWSRLETAAQNRGYLLQPAASDTFNVEYWRRQLGAIGITMPNDLIWLLTKSNGCTLAKKKTTAPISPAFSLPDIYTLYRYYMKLQESAGDNMLKLLDVFPVFLSDYEAEHIGFKIDEPQGYLYEAAMRFDEPNLAFRSLASAIDVCAIYINTTKNPFDKSLDNFNLFVDCYRSFDPQYAESFLN